MLSTSLASITALSRTLQNRPSLRRSSFGISRSVRHSRISGWMPIERSSFTGCWVGFVFSSPALVMAEIEIGLGAVVGHEHFAVLIRRHRSGIEVEIGVEFAETDLVPASLQQGTKCRRSQTLSERRNHAAGDEYVPRHGTQPLRPLARFAKTNRMHGRTFCRAVGDVNLKAISKH